MHHRQLQPRLRAKNTLANTVLQGTQIVQGNTRHGISHLFVWVINRLVHPSVDARPQKQPVAVFLQPEWNLHFFAKSGIH